ncbi:hypothetical protein LG047_00215 [Methylocystis sp. WRRC1]|uniref:hypothetical protein n=1 Tax=Methylocystis sp. WRRC1 TaxID=1732014 RepID=UPI001D153209|nr:hypothetical protein [Methylocystis sp. WRRC1]MCC3243760.1 hypothetical protein [Methylocystis sp. WRRC1]
MTMRAPTKPKPARPARKAAATAPVDPIEVLEQIAGNRRLKPTPRVQAARELLKYRQALNAKAANSPEAKKDSATERLARDLNAKALQLLSAKGTA